MDSEKTILYASCLMLDIAKADGKVTDNELSSLKEILIDFLIQLEQRKLTIGIEKIMQNLSM